MIRLRDTRYPHTAAFLGSAIRVAEYYGFSSLDRMPRTGTPARLQPLALAKVESEIVFARRDERALLSSARKCLLALGGQRSRTLLAWRIAPSTAGIPSTSLELHVVGPSNAIAEALLIIVGNAIIEEAGISERSLSVNSIGSAESSNRYIRDVGTYLRKHMESISQGLRPRAASDPLGALVQLIERGHPATLRAPQSMEYLTEEERRRFWDLLEYLEIFGLPYELDPRILGSRDVWSHALFEIAMTDQESGARIPLISGGRYDPLASRFSRFPHHGVMMTISCEVRGKTRIEPEQRSPRVGVQPAIYFAHLGVEAKRRMLGVLETLRRADIPVHHGLWYDRIAEQMAAARELATPYVLIMGHKEAMEGSVLVREVATNSQDAIPLPELPGYLKRRRVGVSKETRA